MTQFGRKSSFLFIPLFWPKLVRKNANILKKSFFTTLPFLAISLGIILLAIPVLRSEGFSDLSLFTYHNLTQPIGANAIYLSCFFILCINLTYHPHNTNSYHVKNIIAIVLFLFIGLLSSKIFWVLGILNILFYLLKSKKLILTTLTYFGILGLLITVNYIGFLHNRFTDIIDEPIAYQQTNITSNTKFSGLNLRVYFIQKGFEISTENIQTFLFGQGIGDTQEKLNEKIVRDKLYIGNGKSEDKGFLNYNFHNQYIQTFTETGIVGLAILICLLITLIIYALKTKNKPLFIINIIFSIAFLTESYLNRSMGIFFFLILNSVLLNINLNPINKYLFEKRLFDFIFSSLVLIFVFSWFLPIVFLYISIKTKTSPVFIQYRVGQNGKFFPCLKLRTMIKNKDADTLPAQINDSRIFKFGYFLRNYGIDELLQFINILKGEMSVVGPRPLMIKEENYYNKEINQFSARLKSKPGLTGLSQSLGQKGYVNSLSDMISRHKLDMYYHRNKSMILDIKIIYKTIIDLYFKK
jgi:putative colanic acid biosynthesis UDP-glucose lipid carrier transferase